VVSTVLTDGLGNGTMSLVVSRLDTLEDVAERRWRMRFIDPLRIIRVIVRMRNVFFPVPGGYQLGLAADGQWVAQTVMHVNP
jgi:hypothetical protein